VVRLFIASAIAFGVVVLGACSSKDTCDSSKCAAGNTCLAYQGETKCRKTCSSNSDPASSCPFNYDCLDPQNGEPAFCVVQTTALTAQPSGQWGASCQANLGSVNPACDGDQDFLCYGVSPTDGDAYCTRYQCTADLDCAGGFYCATINALPNVLTAERGTPGQEMNVCLKRMYCSPCQTDLDCSPVAGTAQHCVNDKNGAFFCAPECTSTTECPNEAWCADVGLGASVCYPRASVCVGDGTLCSPCRVDTDCGDDGICVKGQFTTEKSCAKKVDDCKSCPKSGNAPGRAIGCSTKSDALLPANYCVGIYDIKKQPADLGCWTPDR
jgi:hypothetical protein